ncbi:hypothetical protein AK812_SmicGene5908 [Symbiodinium microadriaticum]|uniref:Uncharacterized protein n=1 Tax=Symbiodinium microadriaticum TaxID=2951 RepID=A0A1Q9ESJ6_SYMMI|nr:hypothetical protein AK812_SmicGene5908 [Symbiodinium microadriaticum]
MKPQRSGKQKMAGQGPVRRRQEGQDREGQGCQVSPEKLKLNAGTKKDPWQQKGGQSPVQRKVHLWEYIGVM